MKTAILSAAVLGLAGFGVAACCSAPLIEPPPSQVLQGFVTDLASFEQFIATQPAPAQFRARYPDVTLVLPGSIASKELRSNHSRYFAVVDGEGRITGGKFQ